MSKINFIYRGKEGSGKLSIRLVHGKDIDFRIAKLIESKKEYWFKRTTKNGKTTQKHLQLKDLSNNGTRELKDHKTNLETIQEAILNLFLQDFNNGIPITKEWLKSAILLNTNILNSKDKINFAPKEIKQKEVEEKYNCYAIDKFFVEVVYDAEHNTINEVRSFKYGHSLDKYSAKF